MDHEHEPLSETVMAVIDAALAEELIDDLGIFDNPEIAQRYRAQIRSRRPAPQGPVEND